jgi:beta-glucosidase/6-phospho-beta-glucosidase/beta-galactosidase
MIGDLGLGAFTWCTGIEDTFIAQEGPGERRLDEYELQQHYDHWREDVDLAVGIGFDAMRYGVPWYRLEPERGRFDWSLTDDVIPYLADVGIRPIIDLIHYGTPLWLEGSFVDPAYPESVAAYGRAFAQRYGRWVRHYTPVNEPFINAELCGRTGRWPPKLIGDDGFVRVIDALCRGIVRTVDAIRDVQPDAVFVHVEATGVGSTDSPELTDRLSLDLHREFVALDLITGRVDERHPLDGYLSEHGMPAAHRRWLRDHAIELDVLGLNYYPFMSAWRRSTDARGQGVHEPLWGGGEVLERVVRDAHDRYGAPIFITECSHNERALPGSIFAAPPYASVERGVTRIAWLEEAVRSVARLRADGMPLVGFTWWPLFDLVNWDYREGTGAVADYLEPMGLFALRSDHGELRREPLACAERMRAIITASRVGSDVPLDHP